MSARLARRACSVHGHWSLLPRCVPYSGTPRLGSSSSSRHDTIARARARQAVGGLLVAHKCRRNRPELVGARLRVQIEDAAFACRSRSHPTVARAAASQQSLQGCMCAHGVGWERGFVRCGAPLCFPRCALVVRAHAEEEDHPRRGLAPRARPKSGVATHRAPHEGRSCTARWWRGLQEMECEHGRQQQSRSAAGRSCSATRRVSTSHC